MHPKNLAIADFTYLLPADRVAIYPLEQRDNSKLLVYKNGDITTSTYKSIDAFLPAETLLVFNNTKVIEARLLFEKETGGVIEIFCLEPADDWMDITTAMSQRGKVLWKCLVGGASKWKPGMTPGKTFQKEGTTVQVEAAIAGRLPDSFVIELSWKPEELSFADMLHIAGFIPLPPYLHRNAEKKDESRYQTVYAKHDGSVAAPTAGLHFTQEMFDKFELKGIEREEVTLHVGAGTFMPVKSETMLGHTMHAEFIDVSLAAIQNILTHINHKIVAVGTTSLRTVESLYWIGVKVIQQRNTEPTNIAVGQWDPYEMNSEGISTQTALASLVEWMKANRLSRLVARTQILIASGYQLTIASGLVTNFHQPNSTLLLLVAAITGNDWKKIYRYALDNEFRFLSYGDGCLLWSSDSFQLIEAAKVTQPA